MTQLKDHKFSIAIVSSTSIFLFFFFIFGDDISSEMIAIWDIIIAACIFATFFLEADENYFLGRLLRLLQLFVFWPVAIYAFFGCGIWIGFSIFSWVVVAAFTFEGGGWPMAVVAFTTSPGFLLLLAVFRLVSMSISYLSRNKEIYKYLFPSEGSDDLIQYLPTELTSRFPVRLFVLMVLVMNLNRLVFWGETFGLLEFEYDGWG